MAHFAKVLQGTVLKVIVADQKFIDSFVDDSPGEWVQCSYNTSKGEHSDGGTTLRKNFPSPDWTYDGTGFMPPKPYESWTLNKTTYHWESPVAYPKSGKHTWNEKDQSWDEVE